MALQHAHLRMIVNQDGAAILDTRAGKLLTLNSSGAYIWQALMRGEGIDSIAANLARETGEQIQIVQADVADFIDTLKMRGLLPD